jgi:type I restriction enzyme S subunit
MGSVILIKPSKLINNYYLYCYLNSDEGNNKLKTASSATAQPAIYLTHIKRNFLFPLAPPAEQQRIVAKVQQLQQQLSQLEAQVQQSRQYAQQLLQSVLREALSKREWFMRRRRK